MAPRELLIFGIVVLGGVVGTLVGYHQSTVYLTSLGRNVWAGDGLAVIAYPMTGAALGLGAGGVAAYCSHQWQQRHSR